jgi:DeoR/GlpR family transcriptional regulator of sugar metabolism
MLKFEKISNFENDDGIQIPNNSTQKVANEIEKSHGHGISVISEYHDGKYAFVLKGNIISNLKFNWIQISINGVRAGIYNNTINDNKK